jgi:hypothetical protein
MNSDTPISKGLRLANDLSDTLGMVTISALLRFRVKFVLSGGIQMCHILESRAPFNTNNREHTT